MIVGEYNVIAVEGEKKGRKVLMTGQIKEFRSFFADAQLCDLEFIGATFTWCNEQHNRLRM